MSAKTRPYTPFPSSPDEIMRQIGQPGMLEILKQMLLIRNFEIRAESAYQHGKIGGFFHAYIGQEAVQTAALKAFGVDNWYITSYRCHALALLLGATPNELMAELYGKATGNALGRGGSMHFYTERLLGGFGIVGGQIPIATGAAFSLKYQGQADKIAACFFGDGAVAQGTLHESLNLASLWDLPCLYVIENNQWGMGTAVSRALAISRLAEDLAPAYNVKGYTFDGMDFFNCYAGFTHVFKEMLATKRPVVVEVLTERFRGHSISDPAQYRSKETLKGCLEKDPLLTMQRALINQKWLDLDTYKEMDKQAKEQVIAAMEYAENSPLPAIETLGEDVYAP